MLKRGIVWGVVPILVGLFGVVLRPAPARACDCSWPAHPYPASNAEDVPTNATLALRILDGEEIALVRDEDDASVSVDVTLLHESAQWTDRVVRVRPEQALLPETRYRIELDGHEHPHPRRQTFTTGAGAWDGALAFGGLAGLRAESISRDDFPFCSSCDHVRGDYVTRLWLEYEDDPEAAFYVLELRKPDAEAPFESVPISGWVRDQGFIAYHFCQDVAPSLVPGSSVCANLVGYDATGQAAGAGVEICAEVEACISEHVCDDSMAAPWVCGDEAALEGGGGAEADAESNGGESGLGKPSVTGCATAPPLGPGALLGMVLVMGFWFRGEGRRTGGR